MGLLDKLIFRPIRNKIKGRIGEHKVDSKLNPAIFGKVEHRQINNLLILDDNGKSHQIDHVEIRQNGIFCIETKNYSGWIFGNESQEYWTQAIYHEKHQFLNPVKQNKSHVYYLNRVLNGKYKINSLVVMVQNNADKIACSNVINLKKLKRYLANFNDGTHLSSAEMDNIYKILLNSSVQMKNKEHIKNIKSTQRNINNGLCPRCGAKLVKRKGKYGFFYGCSNYPKCNFILKEK